MKTSLKLQLNSVAFALLLIVGASSAHAAFPWPVTINPAEGGRVLWGPDGHIHDNVLEQSGNASAENGGSIFFSAEAAPGFHIIKATVQQGAHPDSDVTGPIKNGESRGYFNVTASGSFKVKFAADTPTGTFNFPFPSSPPQGTTPIFNITGHYTGVTPTTTARNYSIDVAVDTAGKIFAMGTVEGINQTSTSSSHRTTALAPGGPLNVVAGNLSTSNGVPAAKYFGSFAGTRDGTEVTLKGSSSKIPLVFTNEGGTDFAVGSGTYSASVGDVKISQRTAPIHIEVASGDKAKLNNKAWSFSLSVAQRTNTEGKTFFAGSGVLTLQDGTTITFDERPVKYSTKRGFVIPFRKGTNSATAAVDTKVKITILNLTLALQGGTYHATGGNISYRFMGQKGKGPLLSFVP